MIKVLSDRQLKLCELKIQTYRTLRNSQREKVRSTREDLKYMRMDISSELHEEQIDDRPDTNAENFGDNNLRSNNIVIIQPIIKKFGDFNDKLEQLEKDEDLWLHYGNIYQDAVDKLIEELKKRVWLSEQSNGNQDFPGTVDNNESKTKDSEKASILGHGESCKVSSATEQDLENMVRTMTIELSSTRQNLFSSEARVQELNQTIIELQDQMSTNKICKDKNVIEDLEFKYKQRQIEQYDKMLSDMTKENESNILAMQHLHDSEKKVLSSEISELKLKVREMESHVIENVHSREQAETALAVKDKRLNQTVGILQKYVSTQNLDNEERLQWDTGEVAQNKRLDVVHRREQDLSSQAKDLHTYCKSLEKQLRHEQKQHKESKSLLEKAESRRVDSETAFSEELNRQIIIMEDRYATMNRVLSAELVEVKEQLTAALEREAAAKVHLNSLKSVFLSQNPTGAAELRRGATNSQK